MDQDDFVLVPLRTFHRRISGNKDVSAIFISVQDGVPTDRARVAVERLMRERRCISRGLVRKRQISKGLIS